MPEVWYASLPGFDEPAPEWRSFQRRKRRMSRGSLDAADGGPLDLDRAVRGAIRPPRIAAEADDLLLVSGGFRLSLDERVALLWARFRVETVVEHELRALFPTLVLEPTAFAGQVSFGADGELRRTAIDDSAVRTDVTRFDPIVHGGRSHARRCFWDFLPLDRRPPPGCDQLAFTLRGAADSAPTVTLRLMLAIFVPGHAVPLYLELPPSHRELA